jgi:hypothetical protein
MKIMIARDVCWVLCLAAAASLLSGRVAADDRTARGKSTIETSGCALAESRNDFQDYGKRWQDEEYTHFLRSLNESERRWLSAIIRQDAHFTRPALKPAEIKNEFLWASSHTLTYATSRTTVKYHQVVQWVARQMKVDPWIIESQSSLVIERQIAHTLFTTFWDSLTKEQKHRLLTEPDIESIDHCEKVAFAILAISNLFNASKYGYLRSALSLAWNLNGLASANAQTTARQILGMHVLKVERLAMASGPDHAERNNLLELDCSAYLKSMTLKTHYIPSSSNSSLGASGFEIHFVGVPELPPCKIQVTMFRGTWSHTESTFIIKTWPACQAILLLSPRWEYEPDEVKVSLELLGTAKVFHLYEEYKQCFAPWMHFHLK